MQPENSKSGNPKAEALCPAEILAALTEAADEVFDTMLAGAVSHVWKDVENPEQALDRVNIEATVRFSGDRNGTVVLRCTTEGAVDITRRLLMLDEQESIELDVIKDAIGECANMMGGLVKAKSLDPIGTFALGVPKIETYVNTDHAERCGSLVYELSDGRAAVEIWMDPPSEASD